MDALQNWFFWTWRIGNSTVLGYAPSPFWHYQLGLKQGWIPSDPRTAGGFCKTLDIGGSQVSPFEFERTCILPPRLSVHNHNGIGTMLLTPRQCCGLTNKQFDGVFPLSATGGVASPTIAAAQIASHNAWPPVSMGPSFTQAQIAFFPTLTQTGAPITLPTPATTGKPTASLGSGWAKAADNVGAWVTVKGCNYPK
jgi:glucan 1,3-beta-glucosidase